MNIFYVANINLENEDATTRHVFEVCNNLIKIGHQVTLFVPARGRYPYATPVKIIRIPVIRFGLLLPLFLQLGAICYLIVLGLRHKPDVIYTRSTHIGVAQVLAKYILGIPLITEVNGNKLEEARMDQVPEFKIRFYAFFEKRLCRASDRLICVTPGLKKWLVDAFQIPPTLVKVIPNGANVEIAKPMAPNFCREALRLSPDALYVCFVGALQVWQGLEYLVEAAPLILSQEPSTRFIIVGDGREKPQLLNTVAAKNLTDFFVFTGRVAHQQVPYYINASDVCVAPFVKEKVDSAPLKIFEYMACGKPVITSSKIIAQTQAGIMIEAENIPELAESVTHLLKDQDLRMRMGKRARELAVETFSWESVARKVSEVCYAAISTR